jgi:hypothetical protein
VVVHDFPKGREPVGGYLVEDLPLMGDTVGQHYIEGGYPVRGHDQQMCTQVIDVPHFAPMEERDLLELRE